MIKLSPHAHSSIHVTEEGWSMGSLVDDTLKVYHQCLNKEGQETTEEIKYKDAMVVSDSTGKSFLLVHAFLDIRAPVYSFHVPSELKMYNQKLYVDDNQVQLVRTKKAVWLQILPSDSKKKYCCIL